MNKVTTAIQGTITEVRVDGEYAGIIVQSHRGWEARKGGVFTVHGTKLEAQVALEQWYEESRPTPVITSEQTWDTDTVTIHEMFDAWELDQESVKAEVVVHLPGGIDARIAEMVKTGPQVFLSVYWVNALGERHGQILTPTHIKASWVVH